MSAEFQVVGKNSNAPFTLKVHRGEGMVLLAMNWKDGKPPRDFAGFAIEYREPGGTKFFALKNRLSFPGVDKGKANALSTLLSPIQKFRWVHFPRNAELKGEFLYRVTPMFMNAQGELSSGESQEAAIELARETFPGTLNVTFTRGFVSSQAFVDRYESAGKISTLLPPKAEKGLTFKPTHPETDQALAWMGFEARSAILEVLDQASADPKAHVRVIAYDLNEPGIVTRLEHLGKRLQVIIDDSADHGEATSAEKQAETRLIATAGKANVKRQHMGDLQHNKTIVVDGPAGQAVVCGSTNFSWRGFFVQSNNAVILRGKEAVKAFGAAFDEYFSHGDVTQFGASASANLVDIGIQGVKVHAGFSPYGSVHAQLQKVIDDLETTKSSLFYSLAFLAKTPAIRDAIRDVTNRDGVFVYGIADSEVGGIELQKPDGNFAPVHPEALSGNVPEPFRSEPTGGGGVRMHHKFLVVDFDSPDARVYLGSYNFSAAADRKNGENLLLIRDRRVATSYLVEALRIFDHYHFRLAQKDAETAKKELALMPPPASDNDDPWWAEYYDDPRKVRDRELFA